MDDPHVLEWQARAPRRQTVLLVGYSDNYSGLRDVSLTQTDRTFFLKLGYAWVL